MASYGVELRTEVGNTIEACVVYMLELKLLCRMNANTLLTTVKHHVKFKT